MNGETEHLCNIVIAVRKALRDNHPIHVTERSYMKQTVFVFLDGSTADSYGDWFARCCREGLYNAALLMPVSVKERGLLGFSNTSGALLVCYTRNGVTYYTPHWSFDRNARQWTAVYREHPWKSTTDPLPSLKGFLEPFKTVLQKISAFAEEIGAGEFSRTFDLACRCLTDDNAPVPEWAAQPDLTPEQQRIWAAVNIADVFGAMGSWNDSPPGMAAGKGKKDEYDTLSDELLALIRMNLMYVVNET
ncbi:MAG: hypothetical protein IKD71_06700 [Solobacterium sp.]|nr:hypothetical protein [Solobacterium sp.]